VNVSTFERIFVESEKPHRRERYWKNDSQHERWRIQKLWEKKESSRRREAGKWTKLQWTKDGEETEALLLHERTIIYPPKK